MDSEVRAALLNIVVLIASLNLRPDQIDRVRPMLADVDPAGDVAAILQSIWTAQLAVRDVIPNF